LRPGLISQMAKWNWNQHMNRDVEESLSELERETQVRMRCFDRWVSEGKMSRTDAVDRLERQLSAVKHLRDYQDILRKEPQIVPDPVGGEQDEDSQPNEQGHASPF
jgi:hypothetical protein